MYIGNNKSNLTSIVLIPYWIAEVIQSNGLKLTDCLDYEKIRPLLSLHDMATFAAMQCEQQRLLYSGPYSTDSSNEIISYPGQLSEAWQFFTETWPLVPGSSPPRKALSSDCEKMLSYSWDESFKKDIEARLYGPDTKLDRYTKPFDVYNLASNVAGVVVYPGFFHEKPDVAIQHQLVSAVLKVFYVYAPFSEVAPTSLFKRHLELLSSGQS